MIVISSYGNTGSQNPNTTKNVTKTLETKLTLCYGSLKPCITRKCYVKNANNPDKFWQTLKSIYPSKSSEKLNIQSFDIDGESVTNETKIANGFIDFFSTVTNTLKLKSIKIRNFIWHRSSVMKPRIYKTFTFRSD